MGSVTNHNRKRALETLFVWCFAELKGIEPSNSTLEKLGFGSVEAMRIQLSNWEVPDWVTQEEPAAERLKAPKPAPRERKARSSGPAKELPPARDAAPLFREKLEVLIRATEELEHRKEKLQGKRFIQSSVYRDPLYFSRDLLSDEQWQYIRELLDLDPEAKDYMHFGGATFSLGGGTLVPEAPLPALIGAYLLAGGEVETLVETLHPDPTSAEWPKITKRIEGRKGDDSIDGLKVLVEQLATLIRGGTVSRGSPGAELSPREINLACRITERREAGVPVQKTYEELRRFPISEDQEELSWDEFQRLADLELRWPWA